MDECVNIRLQWMEDISRLLDLRILRMIARLCNHICQPLDVNMARSTFGKVLVVCFEVDCGSSFSLSWSGFYFLLYR